MDHTESPGLTDFVVHTDDVEKVIHIRSSHPIYECVQSSILRAMRADGVDSLCDVSLSGVSSSPATTLSPIRAHKIILTHASKYFDGLLRNADGFIDFGQSEYHIEAVNHESLRCIVEFMYTDRLTVSVENAVEQVSNVLKGAEYLSMKSLSHICESFLASDAQLSLKSCIKLWCLSRKYNGLTLMHATSTFIARNLQEVSHRARKFLTMPFEDFAKLLLSEAMIVAKPDDKCVAAFTWLEFDKIGRAVFVSDILNMIPLTYGSVSAQTIYKAHECEMLREHAPETIRKLTGPALKELINMKSAQMERDAAPKAKKSAETVCRSESRRDNSAWYVLGGDPNPKLFLRYDINGQTWSQLPSLPWSREHFGACGVAGTRIVTLGGTKNNVWSKSIDEYNVTSKTWSTAQTTTVCRGRNGLVACTVGRRAFVLGGGNNNDVVEKFDCRTNKLCSLSKMRAPRLFFAAAAANSTGSGNEFIYVAGGSGRHSAGTIDQYDVARNKWSNVGQMIDADSNRVCLSTTISGDEMYLLGGSINRTAVDAVEIFNIRTGQSLKSQSLLKARECCSATTLHNGNVVCVLGGWSGCKCLKTVECFDKREGKWTTGVVVPDMPTPNCYFALASV